MTTAVDTNVLLDALTGIRGDFESAQRAIIRAAAAGTLATSAVCYAEVARRFPDRHQLDSLLHEFACTVTPVDADVAFLAGQFFQQYRKRGGEKTRILADFLIAADAFLKADRLLTHDKRFFGSQFPGLTAITYHDL
jgi:predicted nucleic acid-binding protein